MRASRQIPAALLLAALAGCGTSGPPVADDPSATPSDVPTTTAPSSPAAPDGMPATVPAARGEVSTQGLVTVLERDDGPQVCLGGELDSYPPQCGGPVAVGWRWADHEGTFTRSSGTTWGSYFLTGSFDGTRFTPDQVIPAALYDAAAPPPEPDELATPCPAPPGGWRPGDPATTTQEALDRTFAAAQQLGDYAESWIDQPPHGDNDPMKLVLNVAVTGDTTAAETELRTTWGGALCVSRENHTDLELGAIQDDLDAAPGLLSSSHGHDRVDLTVTYDDGALQSWADRHYGDGVVVVGSALTPVGIGAVSPQRP